MPFQAGQSGNPKGRAKGSVNRRTQLAKLLEPHAEKLIAKMVELALNGDASALRLCIERLIPKIHNVPLEIDLPNKIEEQNLQDQKMHLIKAALDGLISIDDAGKMIKLLTQHRDQPSLEAYDLKSVDSIEASKIYQRIMSA